MSVNILETAGMHEREKMQCLHAWLEMSCEMPEMYDWVWVCLVKNVNAWQGMSCEMFGMSCELPECMTGNVL
jgi:hypothetical protein